MLYLTALPLSFTLCNLFLFVFVRRFAWLGEGGGTYCAPLFLQLQLAFEMGQQVTASLDLAALSDSSDISSGGGGGGSGFITSSVGVEATQLKQGRQQLAQQIRQYSSDVSALLDDVCLSSAVHPLILQALSETRASIAVSAAIK
jgi:hypothetical protein